jgi:hypothetical protein
MKNYAINILFLLSCMVANAQKFGTVEVGLPYMYMGHSKLHAYGHSFAYISPNIDRLQLVLRHGAFYGSGNRGLTFDEAILESGRDVIGWWPTPENQIGKINTAHTLQTNIDLGVRLNFNNSEKFSFVAETGLSYMYVAKHYVVAFEQINTTPSDEVYYPIPYQVEFSRYTAYASGHVGYAINPLVKVFLASRVYYLRQSNSAYLLELGVAIGLK